MTTLVRTSGLSLVLGAMYPCWYALRALDRREFVGAVLATAIGWLVVRAGVELLRPGSAE